MQHLKDFLIPIFSSQQEVVEHCLTLAEQGSLQTRTRALQVFNHHCTYWLCKGIPLNRAIVLSQSGMKLSSKVLTACGSLEGTDRVLLAPRYFSDISFS